MMPDSVWQTVLLAQRVWLDRPTVFLLLIVLVVLPVGLGIGYVLKRQPEGTIDPALVRTFNRRVRAWLIIYAILALGILFGRAVAVLLFFLVSFGALREFITVTPTRRGDHRALFWTFFLFTPLQYVLVGIGSTLVDVQPNAWYYWPAYYLGLVGVDFYGLYTIMIPVYASLLIPARITLSGDHKRFLERSAKIQFGLLVCVYALSHAPALLDLRLYRWNPESHAYELWTGSPAGLLVYLVLLVQASEVLQYLWDKLLGRHVIAPSINTVKSWEGLLGGALSTSMLAILLWLTGVTPFTWYGAALMGLVIALMGFAGSMTMSAIKRDRGVEDYGTLVQGHAGILDRIDALCFAAPVFFHLTRYFLLVIPLAQSGLPASS